MSFFFISITSLSIFSVLHSTSTSIHEYTIEVYHVFLPTIIIHILWIIPTIFLLLHRSLNPCSDLMVLRKMWMADPHCALPVTILTTYHFFPLLIRAHRTSSALLLYRWNMLVNIWLHWLIIIFIHGCINTLL